MKVVLLCNYPFTKVYSGSNIYNERLATALAATDDIDLHLITTWPAEVRDFHETITVHTVPPGRVPYYYDPVHFLRMRALLLEIEPDVVHALSTELLYSTLAASVRNRYPTLLTVYGIAAEETRYFKREYTKIRQHIYRLINLQNERYVLSKIPDLVLDSSTVKEQIRDLTSAAMHIVPAGIDLDMFRAATTANSGQTGPDIFLVTNLEYLKGVDILIDAVGKVRETFPDISVWIGGKGPQREELERQVSRLNLGDNVKFLGFVSDEEKYRHYATCRLVVVASRWDCQPAALFEAAASEKPVIASDRSNPGIVEQGMTGFIFPSEDTSALAERIVDLLSNDELRTKMGQIAAERAVNYDWGAVAERYQEIYNQISARFTR
jgi:glycosyltransferase involved in cell wall biosynthesis